LTSILPSRVVLLLLVEFHFHRLVHTHMMGMAEDRQDMGRIRRNMDYRQD